MKKILIVDDLVAFVEKEKSLLSRADFQIFTATSGKKALALHRAERMDLIITDLHMSDIDGDKLCSTVRKDPGLKSVSIIIVCDGTRADVERVTICGANAHLTKPIRPVQLVEKVGQLLDVPERKSYRVVLKVTVHGSNRRESFFCSSRNISATGMLIETEKILNKGDKVSCAFFLPNADRITAEAEIMRVARDGTGYQYGIRYLDLPPKFKAQINDFIASRSRKA
jgi:CheY-like chemotaxis protein